MALSDKWRRSATVGPQISEIIRSNFPFGIAYFPNTPRPTIATIVNGNGPALLRNARAALHTATRMPAGLHATLRG
jgi:hypothetical protein